MRIESDRFCFFSETSKLSVFRHADDFERLGGIRTIDSESFAYRRTIWKESLGHRLADHRNFLRAGRVLWSKAATLHQRNTHRREKVRADNVVSNAAQV